MIQYFKQITSILVLSLFTIMGQSQCIIPSDFEEYTTTGMSSTIQWTPISPNEAVCSSSDWQPSFFVNQDSLINVRITGEIFIPSSANDDDFVGFVFGYKTPNFLSPSNLNEYYLFDWKKTSQHAPAEFGGLMAFEGFNLSATTGSIPSDPTNTYKHFWAHQENENFEVLEERYGNTLGWNFNTTYEFELIYTYNTIIISINGDEIFHVEGTYKPGLFGVYSFNQNKVRYKNITIEQHYRIVTDNNESYFCEERPVNFHFLDTAYSYVPENLASFEWDFGDNSPPSYDLVTEHTYNDPGTYNVSLLLTNTEQCTDTIFRTIFIDPKPHIVQQPEDQTCYVGDQVVFEVEAENALHYQWYKKAVGSNYWSKMTNSGYFSGVTTNNLQVSNVRPQFDKMQFRCMVDGECFNPVTSNSAQLLITDIPVRAKLNASDASMCLHDSSYLLLSLQELYQISKANLRIVYDTNLIEINKYTTFFQNMNFQINIDSNYVDIHINMEDPLNLNEAIIAAFKIEAIGSNSSPTIFRWDEESTYFLDLMGDTIHHFLYNSNILIHQAYSSGFSNQVNLCIGESLVIDPQLFYEVAWSNGEESHEITPTDGGSYWVNLVDRNGCESRDTFLLQVNDIPETPTDILFKKPYFCTTDPFIEFEVVGGKGKILQYSYNNITVQDSTPNVDFYQIENPKNHFDLSLAWKNICGISNSIQKEIKVYTSEEPSIQLSIKQENIELGEKTDFIAQAKGEGEFPYYKWYIDQNMVQEGPYNTFTTNELSHKQIVKVEMISDAYCFLRDSIAYDEIKIALESGNDFYVPGVITPNGTGINTEFKAVFRNISVYHFSLEIFDLTGRIIYQTNDIYDYWDGNQAMRNGAFEIYTYRIQYSKKPNPANEEIISVSGKFLLKK